MAKKIVLILFLIIVLAAGGFSAFWFYKSSQIEKGIQDLSSKSHISVSGHKIIGFPLQQIIELRNVKINSPEKAIGKNSITFSKIVLSASIFENKFISTEVGFAKFVNEYNNTTALDVNPIEFNSKPEISLEFLDSGEVKISYQDQGTKTYDKNKNLIASSQGNKITFVISKNNDGQIVSRLQMDMKKTSNIDFVKIYRRNYENSIIDGIKTGKIIVASDNIEEPIQEAGAQETDDKATPEELEMLSKNKDSSQLVNQSSKDIKVNKTPDATSVDMTQDKKESPAQPVNVAKKGNSAANDTSVATDNNDNEEANTKAKANESNNSATPDLAAENKKEEVVVAESATANGSDNGSNNTSSTLPPMTNPEGSEVSAVEQKQDAKAADQLDLDNNSPKDLESKVKLDFVIDIEHILTPKSNDKEVENMDPTQISQISNKAYSTSYKINRIEVLSDNFKFSINGSIQDLKDDTNISGFTTIKIENFVNFISYAKESISNINSYRNNKVQSQDMSYMDSAFNLAYDKFLTNFSEKMQMIFEEIAAKNQLSQNDSMVFDVRREKNLDFVINETPAREILGKF